MGTTLLQRACDVVTQNTPPLSLTEIQKMIPHVPAWDLIEDNGVRHLHRVFVFGDFAEALHFTQKVGELAEANSHHPRLTTEWGKVTVEWWTTAIGDLHRNDFVMAVKVDDLVSNWEIISGQRDVVEVASNESFPASDPPGW